MSATEAAARVALHLDARSKLVAPDPVIEGLGVEGVSTTVTADDLHTLVGAVFAPFPDAVLVAVGVDYCRAHHGVRNEDDDRCDFGRRDDSELLTESTDCDLVPLGFLAPREGASIADLDRMAQAARSFASRLATMYRQAWLEVQPVKAGDEVEVYMRPLGGGSAVWQPALVDRVEPEYGGARYVVRLRTKGGAWGKIAKRLYGSFGDRIRLPDGAEVKA